MSLLTVITLINCLWILVYFVIGKTPGMTYTEMMVARHLGACIIALLALITGCLLFLKEMRALLVLAFIFNILLTASLIAYLVAVLRKSK